MEEEAGTPSLGSGGGLGLRSWSPSISVEQPPSSSSSSPRSSSSVVVLLLLFLEDRSVLAQ